MKFRTVETLLALWLLTGLAAGAVCFLRADTTFRQRDSGSLMA